MPAGISLPSSVEAETILSHFSQNARTDDTIDSNGNSAGIQNVEQVEEKWRLLCLSALSYGTDYNYSFPRDKKNNNDQCEKKSALDLKTRAINTLDFFSELLVKEDGKHSYNNDIETFSVSSPQAVLIDCFWLVSSLIDPKEDPPQKIGSSKQDSLEALIMIIQGLSAKLSPIFTKRLQITLDPFLISKAKLVEEKNIPYAKKIRRYDTDMIYRQKKFNLLVEESEGYSKLLTFLFSPQHLITEERKEKGAVTFFIRELMGSFDLDPNRVLDLLLHVLEVYLAKGQKGDMNFQVLSIIRSALNNFKEEKIPQLLGFKLTSLKENKEQQIQEARESLYLTCAYLICHDIVQLKDLVPHLESSITEMMKIYKDNKTAEMKRIRKLGSISLNSAAKSTENGDADKKSTDEEKATHQNQVVALFEKLLTFEAWEKTYASSHLFLPPEIEEENPSTRVLSQACIISPTIANAICSMINNAIEPVYQTKIRNSSIFFEEIKAFHEKSHKKNSMNETEKFLDHIPKDVKMKKVERLEDLVATLFIPLMVVSESGSIRNHPALYCKLCRLFRFTLSTKKQHQREFNELDPRFMVILQVFLVPSLSLYLSNPSISSELWSCVKLLPYSTRYILYDAWRGTHLEKNALRAITTSSTSSKPLVRIESEIETGVECRWVLKRLSKENYRDMGRRLAKACHKNPIVVFSTVLNQIETYDNLIALMIDSFKFITKLSLDVLGYCLLLSIGGGGEIAGGRMSMRSDGMGQLQWLTSLSQFTGSLYKRFPEVEIRPIISHLINELRHGRISELSVLRNLLTNAGGYDFADCDNTASLSQAQLEGRSGSQLLKKETSSFGIVEKSNKKSSKKLREVLQSKELGLPLLVLLAQVKEKIMYESKGHTVHLKVIGNEYDSCQTLLALLLEFLTQPTDDEGVAPKEVIEKYAKILPTLKELNKEYGLNSEIAWMLCRPLVRAAIVVEQNANKQKKNEEEGEEKEEGDSKKEENLFSGLKSLAPFVPSSQDMLSTYTDLIPSSYWDNLTSTLYEYFWSLSVYDITCPEERYNKEIERLKKEVSRLTSQQTNAQERDLAFTMSDKVELDRVRKSSDNLTSELDAQKRHRKYILSKFESKKTLLFKGADGNVDLPEMASLHLLSICIFPRCTLSPEDALYCAKFIEVLHELETPGFYTLQYLDQLITAIAGALFCLTEDEAGNMGVLLCETWTTISNWRYNESKYEKEVHSKPGSSLSGNNTTFSEFVEFYNKWHLAIGNSLLGCLQSDEYIHIRTAIVVLTRVVEVYPTRPHMGEKLIKRLVPLQEHKTRPDIKTMANSYAGQLEKARRDGVWKEQDAAKTKEIIEEEKLKAEEKKKDAERRFDAMKKENEQIDRDQERARGQHRYGSGDRQYTASRRHENQPLSPQAAVFTPANGAPSRDLYSHSHNRDNHRSEPAPPASRGGAYRDRRERERSTRNHDHDTRNKDRGSTSVGAGVSGGTGSGSASNIQNGHAHSHNYGHADGHRSERLPREGRAPPQPPPRQYPDAGKGIQRGRSPPRDVGSGRGAAESGVKRDRSDAHRDNERFSDRDHSKRQRTTPNERGGSAPSASSGIGGGRQHRDSRRNSPERRRNPRRL